MYSSGQQQVKNILIKVKIAPFGLPELQSPFDFAIVVTPQIGVILTFILQWCKDAIT